eukprot:gb/GFBE01080244.1/.p1 GENE.gb/GFBE01080244.1/~~gb/GFBE01080244.1/.p1  ORF type:complete len:600 (+),score=104.47 gb/GFBE01080244.1/:1-1800(+)
MARKAVLLCVCSALAAAAVKASAHTRPSLHDSTHAEAARPSDIDASEGSRDAVRHAAKSRRTALVRVEHSGRLQASEAPAARSLLTTDSEVSRAGASPVVSTHGQLLGNASLVITLACVVIACALMGVSSQTWAPAEQGLLYLMMNVGLNLVYMSSSVPDSLKLARAMGRAGSFSGWILSAPVPLSVFAIYGALVLLRQGDGRGPQSRRWFKRLLLLSQAVAASCTFMTILIVRGIDNEEDTAKGTNAWWQLIAVRLLYGLAQGPAATHFISIFTAPEVRPDVFGTFIVFQMVGLFLGPVIASAAHSHLEPLGCPFFACTPAAVLALQLLLMTASALGVPSLDGVDCFDAAPPEQIAGENPERRFSRNIFLVACLTFGLMRASANSGLEAATAMILEDEFKWSIVEIGMAVGFSFTLMVPFALFKKYFLASKPGAYMPLVRIYLATAFCAAFGLFPYTCKLAQSCGVASCALLVLFSDGLFFPSLLLSNGLVSGLMMNSASGAAILTMERLSWLEPLVMALGRWLGPPLARFLLQRGPQGEPGSRTLYALLQVSFVSTAWLMMEIAQLFKWQGSPAFKEAPTSGSEEEENLAETSVQKD